MDVNTDTGGLLTVFPLSGPERKLLYRVFFYVADPFHQIFIFVVLNE